MGKWRVFASPILFVNLSVSCWSKSDTFKTWLLLSASVCFTKWVPKLWKSLSLLDFTAEWMFQGTCLPLLAEYFFQRNLCAPIGYYVYATGINVKPSRFCIFGYPNKDCEISRSKGEKAVSSESPRLCCGNCSVQVFMLFHSYPFEVETSEKRSDSCSVNLWTLPGGLDLKDQKA